jgi:hypothetical protein
MQTDYINEPADRVAEYRVPWPVERAGVRRGGDRGAGRG